MSTPSLRLARNELFKTPRTTLTENEMINLAYKRARVAALEYGELSQISPRRNKWTNSDILSKDMKPEDVMQLTPKFWKYHLDLIHPATSSTFVLATIQYNLAAGTIGAYSTGRPDLQELMDRIMKFDVS